MLFYYEINREDLRIEEQKWGKQFALNTSSWNFTVVIIIGIWMT